MYRIFLFCTTIFGFWVQYSSAEECLLDFVNKIRVQKGFVKLAYDDNAANIAIDHLKNCGAGSTIECARVAVYTPIHVPHITTQQCIKHANDYKLNTYSEEFLKQVTEEHCTNLLHRSYGGVGLALYESDMVIVVASLSEMAIEYWNVNRPINSYPITEIKLSEADQNPLSQVKGSPYRDYVQDFIPTSADHTLTEADVQMCVQKFKAGLINPARLFKIKIFISFNPNDSMVSFTFSVPWREYHVTALNYVQNTKGHSIQYVTDYNFKVELEDEMWLLQQELTSFGGEELMVFVNKAFEFTCNVDAETVLFEATNEILSKQEITDFLRHKDTRFVKIGIKGLSSINGKRVWTVKLRLFKFYAIGLLKTNAQRIKEKKFPFSINDLVEYGDTDATKYTIFDCSQEFEAVDKARQEWLSYGINKKKMSALTLAYISIAASCEEVVCRVTIKVKDASDVAVKALSESTLGTISDNLEEEHDFLNLPTVLSSGKFTPLQVNHDLSNVKNQFLSKKISEVIDINYTVVTRIITLRPGRNIAEEVIYAISNWKPNDEQFWRYVSPSVGIAGHYIDEENLSAHVDGTATNKTEVTAKKYVVFLAFESILSLVLKDNPTMQIFVSQSGTTRRYKADAGEGPFTCKIPFNFESESEGINVGFYTAILDAQKLSQQLRNKNCSLGLVYNSSLTKNDFTLSVYCWRVLNQVLTKLNSMRHKSVSLIPTQKLGQWAKEKLNNKCLLNPHREVKLPGLQLRSKITDALSEVSSIEDAVLQADLEKLLQLGTDINLKFVGAAWEYTNADKSIVNVLFVFGSVYDDGCKLITDKYGGEGKVFINTNVDDFALQYMHYVERSLQSIPLFNKLKDANVVDNMPASKILTSVAQAQSSVKSNLSEETQFFEQVLLQIENIDTSYSHLGFIFNEELGLVIFQMKMTEEREVLKKINLARTAQKLQSVSLDYDMTTMAFAAVQSIISADSKNEVKNPATGNITNPSEFETEFAIGTLDGISEGSPYRHIIIRLNFSGRSTYNLHTEIIEILKGGTSDAQQLLHPALESVGIWSEVIAGNILYGCIVCNKYYDEALRKIQIFVNATPLPNTIPIIPKSDEFLNLLAQKFYVKETKESALGIIREKEIKVEVEYKISFQEAHTRRIALHKVLDNLMKPDSSSRLRQIWKSGTILGFHCSQNEDFSWFVAILSVNAERRLFGSAAYQHAVLPTRSLPSYLLNGPIAMLSTEKFRFPTLQKDIQHIYSSPVEFYKDMELFTDMYNSNTIKELQELLKQVKHAELVFHKTECRVVQGKTQLDNLVVERKGVQKSGGPIFNYIGYTMESELKLSIYQFKMPLYKEIVDVINEFRRNINTVGIDFLMTLRAATSFANTEKDELSIGGPYQFVNFEKGLFNKDLIVVVKSNFNSKNFKTKLLTDPAVDAIGMWIVEKRAKIVCHRYFDEVFQEMRLHGRVQYWDIKTDTELAIVAEECAKNKTPGLEKLLNAIKSEEFYHKSDIIDAVHSRVGAVRAFFDKNRHEISQLTGLKSCNLVSFGCHHSQARYTVTLLITNSKFMQQPSYKSLVDAISTKKEEADKKNARNWLNLSF